MRVLVTGGSGFIGSHLVPRLVDLGHDVYLLERYVTGRFVLGQQRMVKTVFGDLRDYFKIRQIIREVLPEVVIHLASLSPVSYSYDHPMEVMETNLLSTVNLAESCAYEVSNFKQFLFASTSETYGNGTCPKKEDTPQNPNSPYAVSKAAAEKYLIYLSDAVGFPMTLLRNFNTYGRKDNTHFVVERIISQMLQGRTVMLGDPSPIRDFQFVEDHVSSYLTCLGNKNAIGEAFNFGTGKGISVKQLVDMITEMTSFKGEVVWNSVPSRPLDIKELVSDSAKAKNTLGWEPKFTLEEGLKLTVDYWEKSLLKERE